MSIINRPLPRIVASLNYAVLNEYNIEHMHNTLGADAQISPLPPLRLGACQK
jgi:hypothetical protein